jgi:hypothetical protein
VILRRLLSVSKKRSSITLMILISITIVVKVCIPAFYLPSPLTSIVFFIMNEFAKAAENYTKSSKLDDQFVFSHIQLVVAQYKSDKFGKIVWQRLEERRRRSHRGVNHIIISEFSYYDMFIG